jgi:O-antigen/teichoic acid export membrane protein
VFSLRAFGAFIQFCFQILVARQWGVENFGLFSIALTLTVVSSMVARWGVDQWVLRELPATAAAGYPRSFVSVLTNGIVFVLGSSALVTLCLWGAAGSMASLFMGRETEAAEGLFRIMTLSIMPFAALNFLAETFRAVDRHLPATLLQTVLVPFFSVLLLIGISLADEKEVTQAAEAYVAACLLALVAGALYLGRVYRVHAGTGRLVWYLKDMVGETTSMAMVVLFSTWLAYADILILGYFHGPSEVGLYSAAQRIVLLLAFVLVSINSLLGPRFALLDKQGNQAELFALYRKAVKLTILTGLPIVVLLAIFSGWFLSWFGPSFVAARYVLLILLLGQLVNVLTGPVGILMMMSRHTATLRTYTFVTALTHLPVALILTPLFGADGTAAATCTGVVMLNVLCWRHVEARRKLAYLPGGG